MPGRIQVAAEIRTWKVSLHAGGRRKTGPSRGEWGQRMTLGLGYWWEGSTSQIRELA